jgi:hypothetical protein
LTILILTLLLVLLLVDCNSAVEKPVVTETEAIIEMGIESPTPSFTISPSITPSPDIKARKTELKETKIAETQVYLTVKALTPTITTWKYKKPNSVLSFL